MQAKIYNNLTHFTMYFENIEVNTNNPLYSQIELDLSKMVDGEYIVEVYNNNNQLLSKELMIIGNNQIREYRKNKEYITYER